MADKMNEPLLRQIQRHVLDEPRRVRMEAWGISLHMAEDDKEDARQDVLMSLYERDTKRATGQMPFDAEDKDFAELVPFPTCGTIACVAGWGKILTQPDPEAAMRDPKFLHELSMLSLEDAAQLFGVTWNAAERLCYLSEWPSDFKHHYIAAANEDRRARIVADRIEHFLKTNGAE